MAVALGAGNIIRKGVPALKESADRNAHGIITAIINKIFSIFISPPAIFSMFLQEGNHN